MIYWFCDNISLRDAVCHFPPSIPDQVVIRRARAGCSRGQPNRVPGKSIRQLTLASDYGWPLRTRRTFGSFGQSIRWVWSFDIFVSLIEREKLDFQGGLIEWPRGSNNYISWYFKWDSFGFGMSQGIVYDQDERTNLTLLNQSQSTLSIKHFSGNNQPASFIDQKSR